MKKLLRYIFFSKYTFLLLAVTLITLSFVFNKLYSNRTSVAKEAALAERYLQRHQNSFTTFLKDTGLINRLLNKRESLQELSPLTSRPYGIFLFARNMFGNMEMLFWSDQLSVPPDELLYEADGEYFRELTNGYYYIIKKTFPAQQQPDGIICFAMIPVRYHFFIETDYLPRKFAYSNDADKRVKLARDSLTGYPVKSPGGDTLFYLGEKASVAVPYNDRQTLLLRFSGLLFFFIFIQLLVDAVSRRYGAGKAIALLFLLLLMVRLTSYFYPALFNLRQFELFDPGIYGSNAVQRSLGDLMLNAIFFCWVVLFAWSRLHHRDNLSAGFTKPVKWMVGIFSLCLLIYSTFILATVIRSMVADSQISFDITNFFSLNEYTIAGFGVMACLSLSYYYFSQLLFRFIFPLFNGKDIIIYFAIGFAGLVYLTVRSGDPKVLFYLPVLLWLLVYTWLVNRQGIIFNRLRINVAGILSWIFIFSVSIAAIMLNENQKVEWEKRKKIAEKIAERTDPAGESMMSTAIEYLDNDFLSDNFHRFRSEEEGKELRDSITASNYSGYLNKYDTRLYVYDETGRPVNNEDAISYDDLSTILEVQSRPTNTAGLYYYEVAYDKFNYITRREVTDTAGRKMGTFFIVSNPKNFRSDALFPELFKKYKKTDPENSPIYANAVYMSGQLVSTPGKYPFPISLTPDQLLKEEFVKRTNGQFNELWYKAGKEKIIVIAREKDTLIEAITLFSYIFCSFLFLVSLVQLISLVLRTKFSRSGLRQMWQINIRSQVHSTFIFISVFSFLVIGFSTISFFISRYKRNNSDKLSRTMTIMVNEMQKKLADHNTFDDVLKLYDTVSNAGLQRLVSEVSDIHGVDVNVYDLKGSLQVSSEGYVYSRGVLSKKMDPTAYYHLDRLRQVQHSQVEKIGNLGYLSIYAPVRDEDRRVYAYINIPYFTAQPELEQEISNFLVTIINLNAFIFLIAGLIALLITNRITRSFSIISDKMKEVNLGKHNDEITWSRNDEIGDLVNEYNKMVAKLGASADALAKSEREGAWREMARQVAHEIKNPLTPMKLSIQYLQKAINNNQPNVKELSSNVANTLVEQIDHLSKIAADFSQFANIGITEVEVFDLHDVLGSLRDLYRPNYNVEFIWRPVNDRVMVEADKTQMNRLFTNLFANATEACNGNGACRIEVHERRDENRILISVRDNGEGIAPEMQSRIFIPNFTTKSSGTGLGLAMCKGIVEQAKGRIWFETEQGRGTTFHVELPVLN